LHPQKGIDPMTNYHVDILLVADNPSAVDLTLHGVRQHDLTHRLAIVRDGAKALDFLFCTGPYTYRLLDHCPLPAVVLLDLKLPKVDGLEVLCRLRADPRTERIPVVLLTASREQCEFFEQFQLGVHSYLVKPVDVAQLLQVTQQLGLS
jgi:two-component system, response regulator